MFLNITVEILYKHVIWHFFAFAGFIPVVDTDLQRSELLGDSYVSLRAPNYANIFLFEPFPTESPGGLGGVYILYAAPTTLEPDLVGYGCL